MTVRPHMSSDEQLLAAFLVEDSEAFGVLVVRYRIPIYNFLLRSVRDRQAAAELLREVFLRVIQRADKFQGSARFSTWIFTIARNLSLDHAQTRPRSADAASERSDLSEGPAATALANRVAGSDAGGELTVDATEIAERVAKAVELLPTEQREVFLMRQLHRLSFQDIADVVGTPVMTVKSRMRLALEWLQQAMVEFESSLGELLDESELRALTDDLDEHEASQEVDGRLRTALTFAARLVVEDPPEAVSKAVMKTARDRCGDDAAATTFSTAMLSLPKTGFLGRIRVVATRPQFVMGTVMALAVAFGAWYVPRRAEIDRIGSGAPTFVPSGLAPDLPGESGEGVTAPRTPTAELGIEPPDGTAAVSSSEARLERGLQAFGRSDYVAAIDELNAVASASDVNEDAWTTATHHLARSYTRHGDCESAARRYEQLFARSPAYNQTHSAMVEAGACYRALGNEARARELLDVAMQDPATAAAAQAELAQLGSAPHGRRHTHAQSPRRSEQSRPANGSMDPAP